MNKERECNCQQFTFNGVCEHTATNYPVHQKNDSSGEGWEAQFDKQFSYKVCTHFGEQINNYGTTDIRPDIKSFIRKIVAQVAQQERQRIVGIVKNSRTLDEKMAIGHREDIARSQVIVDINATSLTAPIEKEK